MRYLVILLIILMAHASIAQDSVKVVTPDPPRLLIKVAPLLFFVQTFELSLEGMTSNFTRGIQLSFGYRSGQPGFKDGTGHTGTLAYRKYARPMNKSVLKSPEVKQGIYYSLFFKYDYFKGTEEYLNQAAGEVTIRSTSPGFTLGIQRTIFEVMFVDFYIGGGIRFPKIEYGYADHPDADHYDIFSPAYKGIYPTTGIRFGIGL